MIDGSAALMAPFYEMTSLGLWHDRRDANLLDGHAPFYTTYETGDGGWMAVGPLEPAFYAVMIDGLGLDGERLPFQYDRDRWPELRKIIATRFAQRTRAEWEAVFAGTDACVTPVLSLEEAPEHPQNASRDVFGGPVGHRLPGIAPRFDGRHPDDLSAVREPGTDTTAILSDLGYGAAEISALRRNGTVA
jgi:alpha-methylacyl-CoA racemase